MNGTTPAGNWTGVLQRGEKVRLRFINGSSMTFFDVRIPGLKLKVIAAEGQDVEPVTVDEFRIGNAEVLDVIVELKDDRAYTIFAQSIDRTGYARGTLAPQAGMQAEVPPLDPRPLLTIADMGMAHDMSGMGGIKGMDHGSMSGMRHDMNDMVGMQHGISGMQHKGSSGASSDSMQGMDMPDMKGMDHGGMAMGPEMGPPVRHARAEYGPTVDSLAMQPQSRLDDPGV